MVLEMLKNLDNKGRWDKVFSLASKIKRCGEDTDDGCGCKQPSKLKKEGLATIIASWDDIEGVDADNAALRKEGSGSAEAVGKSQIEAGLAKANRPSAVAKNNLHMFMFAGRKTV